jgi:hypothetical protein
MRFFRLAFAIQPFAVAAHARRYSKLKIDKGHWACCRKKFERQKRQHVCRDLNARWLQSQAINKLIAFLRDRQEQRNEKKHERPGRQKEFTGYVLETE